MKFFQKLKRAWNKFVRRGDSSSSNSTARRSAPTTRTVVSRKDGGGGYVGGQRYSSQSQQEDEEKKRRRERLNAFKSATDNAEKKIKTVVSTAPKTDIKQDKIAENRKKLIAERKAFNEATRNQSMSKAIKTGTEKQKLALDAQKKRQAQRKEWHEVTGNRFNVKEKGISAEERQRRRQNVKSQISDEKTAVAEAKYQMKYHKGAESFARGALSGVTFGVSDLIAKGTKGEFKKAEEVYQKNKSKGAETVGEIAGSLVGFGLTSGASKAVVKKALPKAVKGAVSKGGTKMTAKLASNKLIRKAAEKEVANAVAKGTMKEATKEAVERVAKSKAKELVANLAEDAAVNVTTGAITDAAKATTEHKFGSKEWRKELGKSAAANVALGTGATVGLPAAGKAIKRALGGVTEGSNAAIKSLVKNASDSADDVAEKAVKNVAKDTKQATGDIKVSLNRKRKTDVRLPNEVRTAANQTDDVVENVARQTDNVAPTRRDARDVVRDETVSIENKRKAVDERLDEIDKELDEAHRISGNTSLSEEERLAGSERYDELMAEVRELDDAMREAEAQYDTYGDNVPFTSDDGNPVAGDTFDTARRTGQSEEDIIRTAENPKRTVNDEIRETMTKEERQRWSPEGEKEGYTVGEAQEIRDRNERTYDTHTKQGFTTISTGMGDKTFANDVRNSIENGDVSIEVYHDKENYAKGVERVAAYADGVGGKSGKGTIESLTEDFRKYADGELKLNSREQRDMLYDILAAVDYANGNKNEPWATDLFLQATRAGAETTSVSGLTLRQWHKIAMSSPEHRAKAIKDQIEVMFNRSRGFRKRYGKIEGGIGKLRDRVGKTVSETADDFAMVSDAELPEGLSGLDDFIAQHPEETKGLSEALDVLQNAQSKDDVERAASNVIKEARKVMPVTAFDQLTQWRYVAMLSSPTTHIKNIVGNVYSGTLGQLAGAISSSTENHLIKSGKVNKDEYLKSASGLSVTARNNAKIGVSEGIRLDNARREYDEVVNALKTAKESEKQALGKRGLELENRITALEDKLKSAKPKNIEGRKAQEAWHGISKEKLIMDAEKFESIHHAKGVKGAIGKGIGKMSDVVGMALETSDAVAVERIYRETYEKVLKANGYDELVKTAEKFGKGKEWANATAQIKRIEEYAAQHASYKAALDTYRNYNAVASWLNKTVKNTLYNADAKWYKKAGGFMLNAVMPFTKVPTNILKRSVDYSPIGLIQGKKMLNDALKTGDYAEINKAVERLSEGKIGTGIAMLGAGLGMADPDGFVLTGRLDRNSELDKAKKDRGYMDYSVRVGNRDFTLEWATPTASTFFVGVEIGRILRNVYDDVADKGGMNFEPWNAMDSVEEIISTIAEPALQLGMFQGVNGIIEDLSTQERHGAGANVHPLITATGNIMETYMNSMYPSILGRISKAIAPYDYYVSGETNREYNLNMLKSRVPIISEKTFGARTNAWGEVRGEAKSPADKALKAGVSLLSPMNVSEITWDETDDKMFELSKSLGKQIMPKNFWGYYDADGALSNDASFGRNEDNQIKFKMTNKDKAEYNIARGKAGKDAMTAALDSVIFNRRTKDEKGHSIPRDDAYTEEMKADLIKQFDGKSTKDVVNWVLEQPEFQSATPAEQKTILKSVVGNTSDDYRSRGAKRTSELAMAQRHGISEGEYDYKNEISKKKQQELDGLIESGVLTYDDAVAFARGAAKKGWYETDSGGQSRVSYSHETIMNYLENADLSEEAKEALYNAYYTGKTPYGQAIRKWGRGYRRRGYRRGYRRRGGGGSGGTDVEIKTSAYKAKASDLKVKEVISTKDTGKIAVPTKKSKKTKVTPPKVKFKKYEV